MNIEKRLYQWDTGQKLVGCTGLYVDFPIDNEVYRVETADGMCIIPDELLQTSGGHKVYECMTNNTIRSFAFSVTPRPQPPDYVFTPTERLTFEGLVQKVDDVVADMIRRADSGEFDGHTPVKGTDYFTTEEIQQIQNEVSSGAIGEFKSVVDTETYNFNSNAETKFNAYNQNDSQKTTAYNTNATEKLNAYNSNAENKVSEFNAQTEQIQTDISELKSDLVELDSRLSVSIDEISNAFETVPKTENILDPSTESGYYSESNGLPVQSLGHCRTVNRCELPSGTFSVGLFFREKITSLVAVNWYDENDSFIKINTANNTTITSFTPPNNAKYIRLWTSNPSYDFVDACVVPNFSKTEYVKYDTKKILLEKALPKGYKANIENITTKVEKLTSDENGTYNLLPPDTESGYYSTETGKPVPSAGHVRSVHTVDVSGASNIYINLKSVTTGTIGITFYDDNDTFIKVSTMGTNALFNSYPVPNGAKTVNFWISNPNFSFADLCVSEVNINVYAPYILDTTVSKSYAPKTNHLNRKVIANFGDSIFGNKRYPTDISTVLAEITGATVYNLGFGGCRMSSYNSSTDFDAFSMYRLAYAIANNDYTLQNNVNVDSVVGMPSYFKETRTLLEIIDWNNVDIITIAYGTNDFTAEKPIDSDSNSKDVNTFGGALRYSIETLLSAYPHLKIYVLTPTYRFWINGTTFVEDSDTKEFAGKKLIDFCNKAKDVSTEYHIKCIDNYNELGINKYNRTRYFYDNDGTHHNYFGGYLIAEHMANEMF